MNKKFLFFSLLMVLALSLSACAELGLPVARSLTVTGVGQVTLEPDIAYIHIGVNTEDTSVADAMARNNEDTLRLMEALKAQGVAAEDIRTTNFSIWTNRPFGMDGQPGAPTYVVDNTVYVTARNLDNLGVLLDAAVQAGANSINSIQFDVADKSDAMSEAREAAVEAANQNARELASAAGVLLGAIQTITFHDGVPFPAFEARGLGGNEAMVDASVPITPGKMQLTVTVTVMYAIR